MKIITNHMTPNATRNSARDQKAETGKFDTLLREAVEERKASAGSPTQGPSAVGSVMSLDTAMLLNLDTSTIVDGAERLVGTLEEFQAKLANADVPLEELSPIIEKMDHEKELLLPSLEMLPRTDPLRHVLNNVLVACTVETEKFKRGDYL